MPNIFFEFCKKVWHEQTWGAVSITILAVVGVISTFARLSVPALSFTLPQPVLGLGLFALALILVLFAFLASKGNAKEAGGTPSGRLLNPNMDPLLMGYVSTGAVQDPSELQYRISVSGDSEGMAFWKLDVGGELRAWLEFSNFTANPVKIVCVAGEIVVGNTVVGKVQSLKRQSIAAYAGSRIFVETELSAEVLKRIETQLTSPSSSLTTGLQVTISVECDGSSKDLYRTLSTGNYRFVNFTATNPRLGGSGAAPVAPPRAAISYPDASKYGRNLLSNSTHEIRVGEEISLRAEVPAGSKMHVVLRLPLGAAGDDGGGWEFNAIGIRNWSASTYQADDKMAEQHFDSESGVADLALSFRIVGDLEIQCFEGGIRRQRGEGSFIYGPPSSCLLSPIDRDRQPQ